MTQSNATAQASTTLDVSKVLSDWHRGENQTPDLANIWYRGMANSASLDETEKARFTFLNAEFFILVERLYRQFQLGFVKDEAWCPIERIIVKWFSSALFTEWWESGTAANGEDFRRYVDELRGSQSSDNWGEQMISLIKTEAKEGQKI